MNFRRLLQSPMGMLLILLIIWGPVRTLLTGGLQQAAGRRLRNVGGLPKLPGNAVNVTHQQGEFFNGVIDEVGNHAGDVEYPDEHIGERIAVLLDVRLRLEDGAEREADVEAPGEAHGEQPGARAGQRRDETAHDERNQPDHRRPEREEIRGERDPHVGFREGDRPALQTDPQVRWPGAEEQPAERMREFMPEHVETHGGRHENPQDKKQHETCRQAERARRKQRIARHRHQAKRIHEDKHQSAVERQGGDRTQETQEPTHG